MDWIEKMAKECALAMIRKAYGNGIIRKRNLERWKANEKDIKLIIEDLNEYAQCLIDDCNEYEEAEIVFSDIKKIKFGPYSEENRKLIQEYYIEFEECLPCGYLKDYHSEEKFAGLMERVLGIEYEDLYEKLLE